MAFGLSDWRPKHLLASWVAYWAAAAAVKLSPAIATAWRMSRDGPNQNTISAGFENSTLHLTMVNAGTTVWQGTTDAGTLMLWIVGPPLLLWLAWLVTRKRPQVAQRPSASATAADGSVVRERTTGSHALGDGPAQEAPMRGRDAQMPRQYDDRRIR
jgi:hypothetical protein